MTAASPAPDATGRPVIRVLIAGPTGRMGQVFMQGLPKQDGLEVVGGLRRGDSADDLFAKADVLVDFTHPDTAPDLLLAAIKAGVRPVSGTSNLTEEALAAVDAAARDRGIAAMWQAHYRLAGVLMMYFAKIAARYMDSVQIIETHHSGKADAPSGTAREMARTIRAAHGSDLTDAPSSKITIAGVRGGVEGGVRIHSLRIPGVIGSHDVILGGDDELLTIRHDEFGRDAYVPVVARAIHSVVNTDAVGLIRGAEQLLGLPSLD